MHFLRLCIEVEGIGALDADLVLDLERFLRSHGLTVVSVCFCDTVTRVTLTDLTFTRPPNARTCLSAVDQL